MPWFYAADFWFGAAAGPVVLAVVALAWTAVLRSAPARGAGRIVRTWCAAWTAYLLAVFFPQSGAAQEARTAARARARALGGCRGGGDRPGFGPSVHVRITVDDAASRRGRSRERRRVAAARAPAIRSPEEAEATVRPVKAGAGCVIALLVYVAAAVIRSSVFRFRIAPVLHEHLRRVGSGSDPCGSGSFRDEDGESRGVV